MRVLDLFSGIGGFSLAAHAVGFDTLAFCEIEPFAQRVLARHFPGVPVFYDVKELTADDLADAAEGYAQGGELPAREPSGDDGRVSQQHRGGGDSLLLTAGFPCQDISYAGKGAGLAGERSGLFYEVARLVGELRPDYVLLENVAALLTRGLDAVLGTLASLGYDALWACVPACAVGAPHRRDRVWLLAIPESPDSKQRLEAMYAHVLSRLTPYKDGGFCENVPVNALLGRAVWPTPRSQARERDERDEREYRSNIEHAVCLTHKDDSGSLNPSWVETLMGYPIGYTLPEGEPLVTLPRVWPSDSPDGRGWMTPKSGDSVFASGSTSGRSREMSTHLPTQVKLTQTWPAGLGAPQHEWEPPRLTSVKQYRAPRLKCLGNSIVPEVALLWMEAIRQNAPATCEGIQACDDVQHREQVGR